MNGSSFFDFILLVVFVVFIVSRFLSHKLPRDPKKRQNRENLKNTPPENVVHLAKKGQEAAEVLHEKISLKALEKLEGVEKIQAVDATFNAKVFLDGAKQAYLLYWQAVADRDEETLASLVSPRVFDATMADVEILDGQKKRRIVRIDGFEQVEIVGTSVSGKTALVDVKYTAKQARADVKKTTTNTEAKSKKETSIWTWARNVDETDPNWELEDIKPMN